MNPRLKKFWMQHDLLKRKLCNSMVKNRFSISFYKGTKPRPYRLWLLFARYTPTTKEWTVACLTSLHVLLDQGPSRDLASEDGSIMRSINVVHDALGDVWGTCPMFLLRDSPHTLFEGFALCFAWRISPKSRFKGSPQASLEDFLEF